MQQLKKKNFWYPIFSSLVSKLSYCAGHFHIAVSDSSYTCIVKKELEENILGYKFKTTIIFNIFGVGSCGDIQLFTCEVYKMLLIDLMTFYQGIAQSHMSIIW